MFFQYTETTCQPLQSNDDSRGLNEFACWISGQPRGRCEEKTLPRMACPTKLSLEHLTLLDSDFRFLLLCTIYNTYSINSITEITSLKERKKYNKYITKIKFSQWPK